MKRETIQLSLNEIKANEKNPRTIQKRQFDKLVKSLKEFPEMTQLRPIVVDENNVILGGNMRYRALQKLGKRTTEVVRVTGLTDDQKREFIIKDNVPFGDWDWDALANEWDAQQLNDWGLEEAKPLVRVRWIDAPPIDETAYSEPGKIYQLGDNLLYCGSYADDAVRELFSKRKADATFTDPPYNVAVKNPGTGMEIKNDNMAEADFSDFLTDAFKLIAEVTKPGGGVISWMSDKELLTLKQAMDNAGLTFKTFICWVKSNFTLSNSDFRNAKEMAIYSIKEAHYGDQDESEPATFGIAASNGHGRITRARNISNVWYFAKSNKSADHPTMKPIDLCAKGILAMTEPGGVVFDPFLGSGSTLIAAEQVNRICVGSELDPRYCDVIRKRYQMLMTGSDAGWQEATPEY